jgi:hypothetical protein
MRRCEQLAGSKRFSAAVVAGFVGVLTSFIATVPASAAPDASSRVVLDGPARFEVLTPTLVRLEYAADGRFEDGATFNVVDRNLPVPKFRTSKDGGWLVITTDRLTLRYRDGSGPSVEYLRHARGGRKNGHWPAVMACRTGPVRVRDQMRSGGRPDQRR